jgi:hypothetical protein
MSDPSLFAIHSYVEVDPSRGWGPLQAELERRGFPCRIVVSPRGETTTPHQDRARIMVEALKDVPGEVTLAGISNEGLYMPLVAAARPVRRIVMINAVIPFPGRSFREGSKGQEVFGSVTADLAAQRAPGMSERCPLTELPKVEWVYLYGEHDEAVRPQWERWAAREYLHVDPIMVAGAGHAEILQHVGEVIDAATFGLRAPNVREGTATC